MKDSYKDSCFSKKYSDNDIHSSGSSKQIIVDKMKKDLKIIKNIFATIKTKIQEMEEGDSNITDSYRESASSLLQMGSKLRLVLHNNSKPEQELYLKNLVLQDNQYTFYFI